SLDAAERTNGTNKALSTNLDIFGEPTTVFDLETARQHLWHSIADEVAKLPTNYPRIAFLRAWVERYGDVTNAAKAVGLSRWKGRQAKKRFIDRLKRKGVLR